MKRQCAGLVWRAMPKVERAKDARTGRRTFEPYGDGMGGTAPYYFRQCAKMQEVLREVPMIVHVSSQARPGEREAACPCAKAACGSVVRDTDVLNFGLVEACQWHCRFPVAPFLGFHRAEDCPVRPEADAPLVVRGVIEGARPALAEDVPKGLRALISACWAADWETVGDVHIAKGEIIERRLGPTPPDGGPRSYIDQAVTIESVVARMSKGHARLVAVYENGRARAGWRRRNWASNWEDVGMKALRSWAVGQ